MTQHLGHVTLCMHHLEALVQHNHIMLSPVFVKLCLSQMAFSHVPGSPLFCPDFSSVTDKSRLMSSWL